MERLGRLRALRATSTKHMNAMHRSLFDEFLDYFLTSHEEEELTSSNQASEAGTKTKSLALKLKLKQQLENAPFDYTPLFETPPLVDPAAAQFLQSANIYELVRLTKHAAFLTL
jgi:hypothetical protein